jgi:hypothetical protein
LTFLLAHGIPLRDDTARSFRFQQGRVAVGCNLADRSLAVDNIQFDAKKNSKDSEESNSNKKLGKIPCVHFG